MFKSNSRFAALSDDISAKKENKNMIVDKKEKEKEKEYNSFKTDNNSFKNDGFRERRQKRYLTEDEFKKVREEYKVLDIAKKEFEKQEDDRRKHESLKIENFPELILNKKNRELNQGHNYIEKLKNVLAVTTDNKNIDNDLVNLQHGCILIKKNKLTGKTSIYGKAPDMQKKEIMEEEIAIKVINELSCLHERRSEEYIRLNGYDAWEKNFKSNGWREWEARYEDESDYDDEHEDTEEEYM